MLLAVEVQNLGVPETGLGGDLTPSSCVVLRKILDL